MRKSVCWRSLLLVACDAQASTFQEAISAYNQNKVAEAEAVFRKIVEDPAANPDEKARSHRELGRITWWIDGNAPAALAHVDKADATGEGACDNARLRARILHESNGDAALLAQEEALFGRCTDAGHASEIRLAAAKAALDVAAEADPAGRAAALGAGRRLLAGLEPDRQATLDGSAAALQLALLEGDSEKALQAWKNYFWLTDQDTPQGLRQDQTAATPVFQGGLAPDAAPEARLRLVDLLIRAGFSQSAERFAAFTNLAAAAGPHPLWRKASAYFNARRELEATILASNRRVARGGKAANLKDAARKAMGALAAGAGVNADPEQAVRRAYGLAGQVGETEGYASVHYGHVVQDERRTIEQYGHRAEVGFLVLDNMISNGFNSWLWDGRAAAGGWTSPGPLIVQVRPAYTSAPLQSWRLFSDARERQRLAGRAKDNSSRDLAALEGKDVAFTQGLADRLAMQVAEQIGARARERAGAAGDLRRAFLDEYWSASFNQSIFAHEGRHALDRKLVTGLARLNDANLEYRAKLSELALAHYPRLALVNINDRTIGSGSGHGKANERVLKAYVDWMRRNPNAIAGYDPALPPLIQIDKLTDDQIRAVARGLDPIATGK